MMAPHDFAEIELASPHREATPVCIAMSVPRLIIWWICHVLNIKEELQARATCNGLNHLALIQLLR
jgi:hypothetical protein